MSSSAEHPINMQDMSITFDTFQLDSAEMFSRLEQSLNMLLISSTRLTSHVSREDISTKDLHPLNMSLVDAMFPTPIVTIALRFTISLYLPASAVTPNKSSLIY